MGRYKVFAGPVLDVPTGRTVSIDETELNVIALIQSGQIRPADRDARAYYDRWFWAGEPPAQPDPAKDV